MDILALLPQLPYPPTSQGRIRAHQWLSAIRKAGLRVHVVAFRHPFHDKAHVAACDSIGDSWKIIPMPHHDGASYTAAGPRDRSATIERYDCAEARRHIQDFLETHPVKAVVCQGITMAPLLPDTHGHYRILDLGERLSTQLETRGKVIGGRAGWELQTEAVALRNAEDTHIQRADVAIMTSAHEAAQLADHFKATQLVTVAHSASRSEPPDFKAFTTDAPRLVIPVNCADPRHAEAVRQFIARVWSHVHQRHPHASLMICEEWQTAAGRHLANSAPRITLRHVRSQARSPWAGCTLAIAPHPDARGLMFDLCGAMACGVPAVATTSVIEEQIDALQPHILVADTLTQWRQVLDRCLTDKQTTYERAQASYTAASTGATWQTCWEPVTRILTDLDQRARATGEQVTTCNIRPPVAAESITSGALS